MAGKDIVDLGLGKSLSGSVQYAAVKGAIDSGLNIPCSEEVLPNESRLYSEDRKAEFEGVKIKIIGGKK